MSENCTVRSRSTRTRTNFSAHNQNDNRSSESVPWLQLFRQQESCAAEPQAQLLHSNSAVLQIPSHQHALCEIRLYRGTAEAPTLCDQIWLPSGVQTRKQIWSCSAMSPPQDRESAQRPVPHWMRPGSMCAATRICAHRASNAKLAM